MIDHVSLGVSSLPAGEGFYAAALAPLGYVVLVRRTGTVGFGKRYPELWLNERPGIRPDPMTGAHVCLRASSTSAVDAFHAAALAAGAASDGAPGSRAYSGGEVYAAFVRDPDGNRLEAVTFPRAR